jgi:hypothetical protein
VKELDKVDDIDMNYFENLAQDAIKHISEFGDFDYFVSEAVEPPYEKVA